MKIQKTIVTRIYEIIDPAGELDKTSRIFDIGIMTLIILNVVAVVLGSYESIARSWQEPLRIFEVFSVAIFTIEYLLRAVTAKQKYGGTQLEALGRFITSPMAIVDLLAILPFYLPFIVPIDLRFLRILRLSRLFRLLKLHRYSLSMKILGRILSKSWEKIAVTIFITMLLIFLSAGMMYYIESPVQPEAFPNIPSAIWWAVATLTTVGYGDVYPVTALGKVLAGIIALLGIGLVAMPAGIISASFMSDFEETRENTRVQHKRNSRMKAYRKSRASIRVRKSSGRNSS